MDVEGLRELFPDLVRDMDDDASAALLVALEPRRFRPGVRLMTYGERADTLHLVTGGSLSIHVEQQGEDLLLGGARRGSMVGEVGLVEPGPASATVEATEDVETLALTHARLEDLQRSRPELASAIYRALSREMVERLRAASRDVVRRVGDHEWMRGEAGRDRPGWLARIAGLVRGHREETP